MRQGGGGRHARAPHPGFRPEQGWTPGRIGAFQVLRKHGELMSDPEVDPLLAYMRTYCRTYSPQALRRYLVAQGYDDRQVMAALVAYQSERRATPGGEPSDRGDRGLLLSVVAMTFGGLLLAGGTCGAFLDSGINHRVSSRSLAWLALGLVLFVPSLVALWRLRRQAARRSRPPSP
jgi:hypothetical protein